MLRLVRHLASASRTSPHTVLTLPSVVTHRLQIRGVTSQESQNSTPLNSSEAAQVLAAVDNGTFVWL